MNKEEEIAKEAMRYLENEMKKFKPLEEQIPCEHSLHKLGEYTLPVPMPHEIITDKDRLYEYYDECTPDYIHRGEANAAWISRSSLLRDFRASQGDNINQIPLAEFEEQFKQYQRKHILKCRNKIYGTENLRCFASSALRMEIFMQHYGMETDLLDFSIDKRVALYFATAAHRKGVLKNVEYMKIISIPTTSLRNYTDLYAQEMNRLLEMTAGTPYEEMGKESNEEGETEDDSSFWDDIKLNIGFIAPTPGTTNPRISAQNGVLLCLGKHRAYSLDELLRYTSLLNGSLPHEVEVKPLVTYISTSLLDCLVEKLDIDKITKESLGFDEDKE